MLPRVSARVEAMTRSFFERFAPALDGASALAEPLTTTGGRSIAGGASSHAWARQGMATLRGLQWMPSR